MRPNLRAIEGSGNQGDRAYELITAVCNAVDDKGQGMSFAAILGCLELAKAVIMREAAGEE